MRDLAELLFSLHSLHIVSNSLITFLLKGGTWKPKVRESQMGRSRARHAGAGWGGVGGRSLNADDVTVVSRGP